MRLTSVKSLSAGQLTGSLTRADASFAARRRSSDMDASRFIRARISARSRLAVRFDTLPCGMR